MIHDIICYAWSDMLCNAWYDMIWYGMYDVIRYDTYDMICMISYIYHMILYSTKIYFLFFKIYNNIF